MAWWSLTRVSTLALCPDECSDTQQSGLPRLQTGGVGAASADFFGQAPIEKESMPTSDVTMRDVYLGIPLLLKIARSTVEG